MSPRLCSPPADLPPDDLLLKVFLRLPPEPGHLLAASLVCKRWCRLIRNAAFLRRFRTFYRTPPVLGFFQNIGLPTGPPSQGICFFPTATPSARLFPPQDFQNRVSWVMDCHHGRALLYNHDERELLVWDPMTGGTNYVSAPENISGQEEFTGALVCAGQPDDHTNRHLSPFQIVFLDNSMDDECVIYACVYSSETDEWSDWKAVTTPALVSSGSSALVGNSLYWTLDLGVSNHILEFELHAQEFHLIKLPKCVRKRYKSGIQVMPAEDGGIGFAGVNKARIDFWSRKADHEGVARWTLIRAVNMVKLTLSDSPAQDMLLRSSVVGFAEDSSVLFLHSETIIVMIDLKSMQLRRKALQTSGTTVYPYASFYTRGADIVGIDVRDVRYGIKYQRKNKKKQEAAPVETVAPE
ncbi:hypothetical protein EJB05_23030, partial [Eragrostis curvula]